MYNNNNNNMNANTVYIMFRWCYYFYYDFSHEHTHVVNRSKCGRDDELKISGKIEFGTVASRAF